MICQLPENYDDFIIGEDLNSKKKTYCGDSCENSNESR